MVYAVSIVRNRPKKRPSMTGTRRALFNKHAGICAYCRRRTEMPSQLPGKHHDLVATVEHIVPLSRGGAMRGDNITLACAGCNSMKANMTPHQWAEYMMDNPQWWLRSKLRRVRVTSPQSQPIPHDHSIYILQHGKKAYRLWVADGCLAKPALRQLHKDEPLPIEYDDPVKQAAFEAAYKDRRSLLRVPVDNAAV